MKIVQINAVNRFSSTGLTTWQMHKDLLSRGHDSYVFCANENNIEEKIFQIGNKYDHLEHSFLSHLLGTQGRHSIGATKILVKKLKEIEPDVVMLRNLHSNFINLKILLRSLAKYDIPTTITLHDCWTFTGHCCYFIDSQCDRWKHGCGRCPDLNNWNKSWFFDNSKRNLALKASLFSSIPRLGVIGVSKWVTSFIADSVLSESKVIKTIYNWIDTDLFKPVNSTFRTEHNLQDAFIILGIAQIWTASKGLYDFIEIAKQMSDCVFVMVGKIPSGVELPNNIEAVGEIRDPKELAEFYSMADVFFMPSMRETFGKVTAEALACGTPVVAYNATATPELIVKSCGYIVDPHDIPESINKIIAIRDAGKKSYTNKCREYAISKFNKKELISQYMEVFNRLVNI